MALSDDLISQFVKATKDETKKNSEARVYGTAKVQGNTMSVQLDGSDIVTPVTTTVKMRDGDRVIVSIKDHTATVTGNLTAKAVNDGDIEDIDSEIIRVYTLLADKVDIDELQAESARIDSLIAEDALIKNHLMATEAKMKNIEAETVTITGMLTAAEAEIESLKATSLTVDVADLRYVTATELDAIEAFIYNLDATYASVEQLKALEAEIDSLTTGSLTVETADARYADIEFANIGDTAIENLFTKTGIIDNLTVSNGFVTGRLVGVTILGDIIEGGTIVADKLVIQGEDGLYYRLNTDGVTTEAEQTDYNSLNGKIITAHSITAEKIQVDDLVAFDATIGGFNIAKDSLFSGVKESIDNSTPGIFLGSDGQVAFGDADNYLRFYASYVYYGVTFSKGTGEYTRGSMLVGTPEGVVVEGAKTTDGYQVYSTTDGSTYFCRVATDYKLAISADSILFGTDSKYSMEDVKQLTDHVKIGSYVDAETGEQLPCVELAESDSDFRMRLTNRSAMFADGINDSTVIDSDGIETENLRVKNDIRHYDFVWRRRANGNLGLMWMEVTE